MNNGQIGNPLNATNNLSNKYSSSTNFLQFLDDRKARKEGEKIGKELAAGLEKSIKGIDPLKELVKSLDVGIREKLSQIQSDLNITFSSKSLKEYNKYLSDIESAKENLNKLQEALIVENNKEIKDYQKLITLEIQKVQLEDKITKAMNLQQLVIEQTVAIQNKADAEKALREAKSRKEREAAKKDYESYSVILTNINQQIDEMNSNMGEGAAELVQYLEEANEKINQGRKSVTEMVTGLKDGLNSLQRAGQSLYDITSNFRNEFGANKQATIINRWNTELDEYAKQQNIFSRSYGQGRDNEVFQSLKNDLIDGMTEGVGHIYNKDQIMGVLDNIAEYGFTNSETAVSMAKDIAYAKEYMGLSQESLKDMYTLQVRSGDDMFVKKTLNSIVALQKSGIMIDEQQLDATLKNSTDITDAMLSMGMTGEASQEMFQQLTAYQTAANEVSPGFGDTLAKSIKEILAGDLDTLAEYGINNPEALYREAKSTGDISGIVDALMNSPASQQYRQMAQGDYGLGDKVIFNDILGSDKSSLYSQLTDENINNMTSKFDEILAGIKSDPSAYEDDQKTTEQQMSEYYKKMNEHVETALKSDWLSTSEGISKSSYWNKQFESLNSKLGIIIGVVSAMGSIGNFFSKDGNGLGTRLLSKIGGKSGGEGLSLGGKIFGGAGTSGTLANRLSQGVSGGKLGIKGLKGTKTGAMAGGLAIAAGAYEGYQMLKDGISVGTQGYKDSEGHRIEGTGGFGDGLAAAFTDDTIHDSAIENVGGGAVSGLGKGAAIGAAIGTIIPGVGTVVGGLVGGAIGGLGGLLSGMHKDKKRQDQIALKEQQKQTKILEATKDATQAIKAARDAVLTNRYEDNRYGTGDATFPFIPPTNYGKGDAGVITSTYGARNLNGVTSNHSGIDIGGKEYGSPLGSASSGTVVKVVNGYTWKDSNDTTGTYNANYVDIYNEENGVTYRYYHLADAAVKEGQNVSAGDLIGYIGNTGNVYPKPNAKNPSAGTHLHFSTYKNGTNINPSPYLTADILNPSSTPIMSQNIPSFNVGKGDDKNAPSKTILDSANIIAGLEKINNTLLLIDKRQSDQSNILNALTKTPIHDLGV